MIDVKKIIKDFKVDKKELAAILFPGNAYPLMALNRVIKSDAELSESQIILLAQYINVPIQNVFEFGAWQIAVNNAVYTFSKGDYTVRLDANNWNTKIFKNDQTVHQEAVHSHSITMEEYFKYLDKLITKIEKNGKAKN